MIDKKLTNAKRDLGYFSHMKKAIELAYKALEADQWPVGAVIVKDNQILAQGYNQMEILLDPSAHAEILVARQALQILNADETICNKKRFLQDCQIYVTLQPCKMCFYTLRAFRIGKIIYGARQFFPNIAQTKAMNIQDIKTQNINAGQMNEYNYNAAEYFNDHDLKNMIVQDCVYEEECRTLLHLYAKKLRKI